MIMREFLKPLTSLLTINEQFRISAGSWSKLKRNVWVYSVIVALSAGEFRRILMGAALASIANNNKTNDIAHNGLFIPTHL
jgi:hypothetical protein